MAIADDSRQRMKKTAEMLAADLAKVRTGRARPDLLDGVTVSCYGQMMPLSQVASVTAVSALLLLVSPWDRQNLAAVEKALRDSDLGINPATEGGDIRVAFPPLSEERRRELVKVVGKEAESAKIAMRNIRRDALGDIKRRIKDKEIGEDEGRRLEQQIQKMTDEFIAEADALVGAKQQELMSA